MAWAVVILLAIFASYLGYRHSRLLRRIRALDNRLREGGENDAEEGVQQIGSTSFRNLAKTTLRRLETVDRELSIEINRRQLLEALLNEIENPLLLVDEENLVHFSNESAELLFSTEQDHEGRTLLEVTFDHRLPKAVEQAQLSGGRHEERIELNKRSYLLRAEPLDAEVGLGEGTWLLFRDQTDAEEIDQVRQDFVANASHELKTPLAIIMGYLEVLAEDDAIAEDKVRQNAIATMSKHGERLHKVVEDMLRISRLENAEETLNHETFDLKDCMEDAIDSLQPLIREGKARIHTQFPPAPEKRSIKGDQYYWDHILTNLIENALKQNPEPGLEIDIAVKRTSDEILISIVDNGIGIPSADLPHIFKRFFRVEKHHGQEKVKGTGLGLSIVKRAVEAHGGSIEAESQPGERTSFTVRVPAP